MRSNYITPVMRVDPTGHAWWHWVLGGLAVVGMAVLTVVTMGAAVAIAAGVAGAIAGGVYGGMTAAANGQNIWVGICVGALAGAFMGMGAAIAAPLIFTGGLATVGGLAIAAGTGFVGGMFGDAMIQANNGDGRVDWGSAAWTGLQWGVLNTLNALTAGLAGNLTGFGANFALGLFLNFMYGSIGLLIDVIRGQKKKNTNIGIQANINSAKMYYSFA